MQWYLQLLLHCYRFFSTEATPSDDIDCSSRRALTHKQLTQQSPDSVRKILFVDKEIPRDSILKMRSEYQYFTKKPRTESPLERLDQSSQPSPQQKKTQISRNPFLKPNSTTNEPASFTLTSQDLSPTIDHATTTSDPSPTIEPVQQHKVMTSASFLTTHPSHTAQQSSGSWLGKKKTGPNKRATRVGE